MMDWNSYFINLAHAVKLRSKDPNTKVGCVIVNADRHIISTGYNGMPPGFDETDSLWRSEDKYNYVIHAEMNALLHSTQYTANCVLYTTMFPCKECAKAICSAGIKAVYYSDSRFKTEIATNLFNQSGVKLCQRDLNSER